MHTQTTLRAADMMKKIKPHIPLIKFRKGAGKMKGAPSQVSSYQSGPLPAKFARKPFSEEEIKAINSGGVM